MILKKIIRLNEVKEKALIKLLDKMHKYKTRLSYCLKCRKNTKNSKISRTSNGKTMILSNCGICGSKKSRFIKKQEAKGLLSSMVYKFFDKKPKVSDIKSMSNQQLVDELHKPIIKNFNKEEFIHCLKTVLGMLI